MDNIATTEELIFSLKKHRVPSNSIKGDLAKAFGMVDWEFLYDFLLARGFSSQWVG